MPYYWAPDLITPWEDQRYCSWPVPCSSSSIASHLVSASHLITQPPKQPCHQSGIQYQAGFWNVQRYRETHSTLFKTYSWDKDPPPPELLGEACDPVDEYVYTYMHKNHIQGETSLSHTHPPQITHMCYLHFQKEQKETKCYQKQEGNLSYIKRCLRARQPNMMCIDLTWILIQTSQQ